VAALDHCVSPSTGCSSYDTNIEQRSAKSTFRNLLASRAMSRRVTLTNVRLWDGLSDGYLEADAITIQDERVAAVGERADLGGEARDMSGLTVIPGLIDAHVHMSLNPDIGAAASQADPGDSAAIAERAAAMVRAGITTARDLGGGNWLEIEVRDRVRRGEIPGPRLLCAGQPVTSPQGHCHFWGGEAANLEEALAVIARQIEHDADLIKVMATGGNLTVGSDPILAQFDLETLTAMVAEAKRHGRTVAAHCHGTAGIRNASHAGVHTIEHCSWRGPNGTGTDFDPDTAAQIAKEGIWVSPTVNSGWKRFIGRQDFEPKIRENYRRMREAGVRLIASTDAGIPNVYHDQLAAALPVFAHYADLTPVEVLRAATSDCALALGLQNVTGALKPGLDADLLLVEGDPLSDLEVLTKPVSVFARGTAVC
jgi:imidazolonepropionase-like amidohydrolase